MKLEALTACLAPKISPEVFSRRLRGVGLTLVSAVGLGGCGTVPVVDAVAPAGHYGDLRVIVTPDDREAMLRHRRAAEDGDAAAQSALGLMYLLGRGVPRHDRAAAMWFQRAADQDDPAGQYHLGLLFLEGRGVAKDIDDASAWLRRANDQDSGLARRSFDALYRAVTTLPDDVVGAATWFRRAAEGGLPYAQLGLAKLNVLRGDSETETDPVAQGEMIEWLRRAAEQGQPDAQLELGLSYLEGRGVAGDPLRAHVWLNLAAAAGDVQAMERLDPVEARLSRNDLVEAQRLALEWHERLIASSLSKPEAGDEP